MAEMKRKLRRVMSLVLVFTMVVTMGTSVQAQALIGVLGQNVQAVADQIDVADGDEKELLDDSTESESSQKQEESKEPESTRKQEESEETTESESMQKQEESTEAVSTEQEKSTETESTEVQEETTETQSTEVQEETTETESTEEEEEEATATESIDKLAGEALEFDKNYKYAIVSTNTGLAMNITDKGWTNHTKVEADYYKDNKKISDSQALFIITPGTSADIAQDSIQVASDEIKVRIECPIGEEIYPLRTESGNNYAFADADKRYDQKQEIYIIKKTGENQGTIQAASNGRYATIDNGELRFKEDTIEGNAERFEFVENPGFLDATISIKHAKSGNYIKTYKEANKPLTVDGNEDDPDTKFSKVLFGQNDNTVYGEGKVVFKTVEFISQEYSNGIKSANWDNGAVADKILTNNGDHKGGGWESIRIIGGNEDGSIFFKNSYTDQYITVENNNLVNTTKETLTEDEKFYLCVGEDYILLPVTDFEFDSKSRTTTTIDLSWKNPQSLFTGIELYQKGPKDADYKMIALLADEESYKVEGLTKGSEYSFKICTVLYNGKNDKKLMAESDEVTARTRLNEKPGTPQNVQIERIEGKIKITWDAVENATGYKIFRAPSMFGEYEEATEVEEDVEMDGVTREIIVTPQGNNIYENYYRVVSVQDDDESDESDAISLETEMFGDHTIIFAETDDVDKIDAFLLELFDKQNDYNADAQFNGEQWQIYFKPGDYTKTSCMYLGFYTSFNGLGKTPYDVRLNNIAIPAYLPGGALGGNDNNATCNFWRSAENLSVIDTKAENGKAGYGAADKGRQEDFNWAVAQAAPLRRVYSTRKIKYDWNYGWASGGYVADCFIDVEGDAAGTPGGQQFFTRNSKVTGNTFGTTLNNFFMGVEAANNLPEESKYALKSGQGFTNWGIPGELNSAGLGSQQVVTEITSTPKISEKPFLYLDDDGEYKVFVPAVRENARGISWGDGKANNGMGEGTSLSLLESFYIAKPADTAKEINEQIAGGKNIYFTPGIYHVEEPIVVDRKNAILLGTGMASIIPDNADTAMRVGDKDGIRIEGLIFDAGLSSKLLLQVGTKGTHTNHSENPIILQDLFFRVGGTTDVLTKADDALEINSDDVIGDHFWIWRADHGAGVEWYGNESKHGLIVNGDRVKCYALFNEHFQEYHTLWNGEDGATYFYQNETCYDPISQEAWMSHNGTVNGYSSYKVSNDVENHYAVGLGVYNVFIYTGPSYDASGIGIQLDNAIEVPNKEGVLVENACTQTFANDEKEGGGFYPLSKINHIINGIGGSVSSGISKDFVRGEGWSRKFVLYYQNGEAAFGKEPDRKTFNYNEAKDSDQRGKFVGIETVYVEPPADETIYLDRIVELYNQFSDAVESDYTEKSWTNAAMDEALATAKKQIDEGRKAAEEQYSQSEISALQTLINKACTNLEAASEKLVYIGEIKWLSEKYKDYVEENYASASWKAFAEARDQLNLVLDKANQADPTTKKQIYELQIEIDDACEALTNAAAKLKAITEIGAESVTLDKNSITLKQGNTTTLRAAIIPSTATNQKVKWGSSDSKIAKVDNNGLVTAIKEGTAVITVTTDDGGFQAECEVTVSLAETVKVVDVNGIKLDSQSVTLNEGQTHILTPSIEPENASNRNVIWSSSDETVATIRNGVITAIKEGTATITVTAEEGDGKFKDTCEVTVIPVTAVRELQLDREILRLKKDESDTLSVTFVPNNVTNQKVTWGSSNTKIATVDSNGKVTAVDIGEAVITVMTEGGGHTASCRVIVSEELTEVKVEKVTIDPDSLDVNVNQIIKLKAVIEPAEANSKVTWSSSDESVATVDANGNVTAVAIGKATITVMTEDGGHTASCVITVLDKAAEIKVEKVTLDPSAIALSRGEKGTVQVIIEPENATNKNVTWSSDNETVAKVDEKGNITAVSEGSTTITVTTEDGGYKAECKVNVGLWIEVINADSYYYTGTAITPQVHVYDGKKLLTEKIDYTISYKNNTNADYDPANSKKVPTIVVKGKGNYSSTETTTFVIAKPDIKSDTFISDDLVIAYNAKKAQKPVPTLLWNGKSLKNKKDYTVTYYDSKGEKCDSVRDEGEYKIVLEGKGNFEGTREIKLTVSSLKLISKVSVSKIKSQPYTGELIPLEKLGITVKNLAEENYVIRYDDKSDNINIGTAYVIIEGRNDYIGTKRVPFQITGPSINKAKVEITSQTYTGSAIEPEVSVMVDGTQLVQDKDYKISWQNNLNAGSATVVLTGIKGYTGTLKKTFKIQPYNIGQNADSRFNVEMDSKVPYAKGGAKPKLTVTFQGSELAEGTDYTVTYKKNTSVSPNASLTIKGKGNFTGTLIQDYEVTAQDIGKINENGGEALTLIVADKGYQDKKNNYNTQIIIFDVDGKELKAGKDYNVEYRYKENDTPIEKNEIVPKEKEIKVVVTGKEPCYTGTKEGTYKFTDMDFSKAKITINAQEYTGREIILKDSTAFKQVKVGNDDITNRFGTAYEIIRYQNNTETGTANVIIKGKGRYGGVKTVNFKITAKRFLWWRW